MDVSSISAALSASATNTSSAFKQSATDFKSLAQALQSGDLAGAQQAFATLQQDSPWVSRAVSASDTANGGAGSTVASALQTLSKALQSGDISGAQQAFAALQQAFQTGHHGHHHHAPAGASSAPAVPVNNTVATVGSNVNTAA